MGVGVAPASYLTWPKHMLVIIPPIRYDNDEAWFNFNYACSCRRTHRTACDLLVASLDAI